eukprot:9315763-Pyramimonas_sp.AAC.1
MVRAERTFRPVGHAPTPTFQPSHQGVPEPYTYQSQQFDSEHAAADRQRQFGAFTNVSAETGSHKHIDAAMYAHTPASVTQGLQAGALEHRVSDHRTGIDQRGQEKPQYASESTHGSTQTTNH